MLKALGLSEQRLDQIVAGYERSDLAPVNKALLRFALKFAAQASSVSREDVNEASSQGLTSEALLDAVLTTALSEMLCALSTGVGAVPDFAFRPNPHRWAGGHDDRSPDGQEKYPDDFEPFSWLREQFWFCAGRFSDANLEARCAGGRDFCNPHSARSGRRVNSRAEGEYSAFRASFQR
jgi:hypothetical protein